MEPTPKRLVSRARTIATSTPASVPKAISRTRPEGTSRPSSRRSPGSMRGNGTTTLAVRARGRSRPARPLVATGPDFGADRCSPRAQLERERAEQDHLVLELHAELLPRPASPLAHQVEAVLARRAAAVLDEVRVARRDERAADRVPLQPAELEHLSGADLSGWVLEHRAEGPLVRRLGCLSPGDQLRHVCLDLVDGPRGQAVLDARDDLVGTESGVAVLEPELIRTEPPAPVGGHDECTHENRAPVGAVRARVHPDAATRGARDGAGELEAAEPRVARAVQADRVRRAAPHAQEVAVDLDV